MTDDEIRTRIETGLRDKSADGIITCAQALGLAKKLGVAPAAVGAAADDLRIKIRDCQLGCFGRVKK